MDTISKSPVTLNTLYSVTGGLTPTTPCSKRVIRTSTPYSKRVIKTSTPWSKSNVMICENAVLNNTLNFNDMSSELWVDDNLNENLLTVEEFEKEYYNKKEDRKQDDVSKTLIKSHSHGLKPVKNIQEFGDRLCMLNGRGKVKKGSPLAQISPNCDFPQPQNKNMCQSRNKSSCSDSFFRACDAMFSDSSPLAENHVQSRIINRLRQNVSRCNDSLISFTQVRKNSILHALEDAQKLHDQLTQSAIGPFYGLPSVLPDLLYKHKKIDKLYEWQQECLLLSSVKQRKNLIYGLPTSGGKTLVAEILILRELLCHLKDAILVLPYISIVQEKVRGLSPFAVDLDFVIEECAGIKGTIPPRKRRKRHVLYICTIEKAHSLINSLIELNRIAEIGLLVVDELHMIGEAGGRGATLESLLAKILYSSSKTQIIGMSATLSNMEELQKFIRADIYTKNFRPIELKEYVKLESNLFELGNKHELPTLCRTLEFNYTKKMLQRDPDMLMGLVMEVVPSSSCLVFCPTKKHCENVAVTVCDLMPDSVIQCKREDKKSLLKALISQCNGNVCEILKKSIPYGVAYHHSGLTMDERKLIEEAYLGGTLCCLTCTSTLAAGVNLPAKRVILRAPYVGLDFMNFSKYKQMVGRAGRAGIDTSGESILIIKETDKEKVLKLLSIDMDTCQSGLLVEPERLQTLLLSLIGLGIATSMIDIYRFMGNTLAAVQCHEVGSTPSTVFEDSVNNLQNCGLVEYERDDKTKFVVTKLGKAVFRGGVDIGSVEMFLNRLKSGLNGLVLHSHLHLLFIVTPTDFLRNISMNSDIYFKRYMELNPGDIAVAEQVGVSERNIMLMASGRTIKNELKPLMHHFYITLILYDLWLQNSVWFVAEKYNVHRGVVQNLLNTAGALAATLSNFCQELPEFWAYHHLLPSFAKQLSYCVTMELIPLMELPSVKRGRARQLFVAGFKTLADIARANPNDLVKKVDHLPTKVAAEIVSAAKMMLLEKAEALQEEAEDLVGEFTDILNVTDFSQS